MARILETDKEHKVRCPKCGKRIGFTIDDDVWSVYEWGLDGTHSWLDPSRECNYISCPNCDKTICVNDILARNK